MAFLGMALTFVCGLGQLSALAPRLAPILLFSEIKILSYELLENKYQPNERLIFEL